MTTASDKTLDRIRGYLAIAEHPNTGTEEAETFRERAYALMAKYGIERAHLAAAGQITDELASWGLVVNGTHQAEQIQLLAAVVNARTCRVLSWRVDGQTFLMVSGYQSDLDAVQMLYASLALQMAKEVKTVTRTGRKSIATIRKSFMLGFASRVGEKLREANKTAAAEAPTASTGRSTELVLRDRRAAVDDYFNRQTPNTRASKGPKIGDSHAFLAGRDAGDRSDIGGSARLGRSGQRAINA
ncbi:DUF2786 domain-containing protein [Nonomuraea rhizosphaerae]|uniref:DUF2786 domain-containing protein n=1 Tax=Nonomuraea rhizosphaerae TaxID=2665663 RepID=UPI001C5E6AB4|nr:DUF2786 domain-containing protein [Nonomuraea rhizosphaerae]